MHLLHPGGCRNISVLFAITGREDITQSGYHWWQMCPLLTLKGLPLLHKSRLNMRQQLGSSNGLHVWSQRKQSQRVWNGVCLEGCILKEQFNQKLNVSFAERSRSSSKQSKCDRSLHKKTNKKKRCRIFTQNLLVNFKQLQARHWIENEREFLGFFYSIFGNTLCKVT